MRNLKKVLSLVLCMAMMLSIMVVGAGAAFKDQSKIVNEEAVDMCAALNIINGYTDGSFKPEGTITRAEACKMICVALNGGKEPILGTNATASFTDIKGHWAEGYIEYCVSEGIVAGIGGGKFNPNGNVTGSQFAKMLLIALGYRADHEKFVGNAWEVNVNVKATQKGLYEDLATMDPSVALSRDNAAQMVWNALQAKEVKYEYTLVSENGQLVSKVTVTDKDMPTLLADKYGVLSDQSARMIGFTYNSDKDEWTYLFDGGLAAKDQKIVSDVDYTDLYLQNVKVVYTVKSDKTTVDEVYGMYAGDSVVLASAYVGDFDVTAGSDEVTIGDTDYDLQANKTTSNVQVFTYTYGTTAVPSAEDLKAVVDNKGNSAFEINAVDYDDNGDIDFFVMYKFEVNQIDSIGAKNFTLENPTIVGSKTAFDFEKTVTYNGMAEDDFVVYTPAKYTATNDDTFTKVDSVLAGDVTAYKNAYEFAVDGTWYKTTVAIDDLASGSSIKDAPVVNGYLFGGDTSTTADVSDYAVIVKATGSVGLNGPQAELLYADGTKDIVDTDVDYSNMIGWLVTYDTNSDDEYVLTAATPDAFDDCYTAGAFEKADLDNNGKIKYINNWNINDDAVIFVKDGTTQKVITGAQLKTLAGANADYILAYVENNSSTGFKSVVMAQITFSTETVSADNIYGYITADPYTVQNADDKSVTTLTIWNEDGKSVTLNTKAGLKVSKDVAKGAVVTYSVNADGEIDKITFKAKLGDKTNTTATSYVSSYDGTYIAFDGNTARYEITKDTTVVYVDVSKPAGSDNGSIKLATKNAAANSYYDNVYAVNNESTKEVEVLFVDINNDINKAM